MQYASQEQQNIKKKYKIALSLCGGGVRGFIQTLVIQQMQQDLGIKVFDFVDLFAGTSIGSILAGMYSMNVDNQELINLFEQRGSTIFKAQGLYKYGITPLRKSRYSSENLKYLLNDYIGKTQLTQTKKPFICTSVDITDSSFPQSHLFSSDQQQIESIQLLDVLLASSAAPTYFNPVLINNKTYIDGGIACNDPSLCAYAKLAQFTDNPKQNLFIISIGTGVFKGRQESEHDAQKLLYWAKNGIGCVMSAAQNMNRLILPSLFENPDKQLHMLDILLDTDIPLDDIEQIPQLRKAANDIINSQSYKNCIQQLKLNL